VPPPPWLQQLEDWRRRLGRELSSLPDTLSQLREGVENFRRVTQRLDDATSAMEQYGSMPTSALSEVLTRADEVNRAFREQIATVPGGDKVAGALEELTQSLTTVARLNPWWARAMPKPPPPPPPD
jgi:hypothetical protein